MEDQPMCYMQSEAGGNIKLNPNSRVVSEVLSLSVKFLSRAENNVPVFIQKEKCNLVLRGV